MNNFKTFQTYTLNSDQDEILYRMLAFFGDVGLPAEWDEEAFDSLCDMIYDPK